MSWRVQVVGLFQLQTESAIAVVCSHFTSHGMHVYTCIIQIGASFCMALREYPSFLRLVMLFSHNINSV